MAPQSAAIEYLFSPLAALSDEKLIDRCRHDDRAALPLTCSSNAMSVGCWYTCVVRRHTGPSFPSPYRTSGTSVPLKASHWLALLYAGY